MQCHGKTWVDGHFAKLDRVGPGVLMMSISSLPRKGMLGDLYDKGLLDNKRSSSTNALKSNTTNCGTMRGAGRGMGGGHDGALTTPGGMAFMSARSVFNNYMEEARDAIKHNKKAYKATDFPNATGNTTKPVEGIRKKRNKNLLDASLNHNSWGGPRPLFETDGDPPAVTYLDTRPVLITDKWHVYEGPKI